jgi:hypothetical protein
MQPHIHESVPCRLVLELRTYHCNAVNRCFGDLGRCHWLARNTFVLHVYRLRVELRQPFLPDIQCVDDDVVSLPHIFAKKSVHERARN